MTPASGPSLLSMLLAFAFVLALIPAAVWLLKRLGTASSTAGATLRVVAQLPLGARERLVVVQVGGRLLLLGVTASAITRVGALPGATFGSEADGTPSGGALRRH
ncbi:MAG: flagellar biosynthetic protein FliO [Sutterellaceae bacterium]|nr:flagellar biosynthetic protein FliO [Burkholderiaceae bacterium]MDW8431008.1 flagellar biosynthetic protein FliO [Sutterellaceae bacterium]